MVKKIIILVCLILFSIQNSFSAFDSDFSYIGFKEDINSEFNKISYYVKKSENINNNQNIIISMIYNNVEEKICETSLENIDENTISKKITCNVPKKGKGQYIFISQIIDSNIGTVTTKTNFEYLSSDNSKVKSSFIEKGDKTTITFEITGNQKNLILKQEIPKTVIEYLDENNQDSLIKSSNEYKILENDPLIAWNIEQAPTKINYTINKKISDEEKKEFKVILENDSYFNNLKYLIIILILFIVLLTFKPLIQKKKK